MLRIALTAGEPAGIGPDLCVMLAQHLRDYELIVIGNKALLAERAAQLSLALSVRDFDASAPATGDAKGALCILDVPLANKVTCGVFIWPKNLTATQ